MRRRVGASMSHSPWHRRGHGVPGYRAGVSPRTRIGLGVGILAVSIGIAVAGITIAMDNEPATVTRASPTIRPGTPPLSLDLGVRVDGEALALREGFRLYEAGQRGEAERLFARHSSLEARIGAFFSRWPDGTLARLTQLSGLHPRSAAVQLNLGIAQYWSGVEGAQAAWRSAAELEPDTAYAVTAGNLLHPEFAPNLPLFVPTEEAPAAIRSLSPPVQLKTLERRARTGSVTDRLFYGVALQRLGRQISAERVYAEAARLAPNDPEARVAAAVGRFAKADPSRAFSRLGPLSRAFPAAATVRFHLGLLLLWSGEVKEARRQLLLARSVEPRSPLARVAKRYIDELDAAGV